VGKSIKPIYLHNWSNREGVEKDFQTTLKPTQKILLASYGYGSYCGDAFVLFQEGNNLYEVNGSHCSCFGLEGQWDPEKTSVKSLKQRLEAGLGSDSYTENIFTEELREVIQKLDG